MVFGHTRLRGVFLRRMATDILECHVLQGDEAFAWRWSAVVHRGSHEGNQNLKGLQNKNRKPSVFLLAGG